MKKITALILTISLVSIFALAGCGSDNKVSDGVTKMLDTTEKLSKAKVGS